MYSDRLPASLCIDIRRRLRSGLPLRVDQSGRHSRRSLLAFWLEQNRDKDDDDSHEDRDAFQWDLYSNFCLLHK